ncbi:MAG: helix-turn-helix domain-containing protein, partial [Lachnospiraceae bacterium]|nr:helix-turn-helix domain-containing protein [Lachnospiraceae bacterium]
MGSDLREESWIGTKEAAEFLDVKPATIRDWIRKGKDIPRRKIGKAW